MVSDKDIKYILNFMIAISLLIVIIFSIAFHEQKIEPTNVQKLKHQIDSLETCLEFTKDSLMQFADYRIINK